MAKTEIAKAKDIQVARAKRFVKKLDETISVMEKVIHQTEKVLSGVTSIPDRIVSIFDQKARPIRRGKAKADTEFGIKVVLTESEEKLIISYKVLEGNPSDKGQAVPAIKKAKEVLGRAPGEMAADRGFFSEESEVELHELGVRRVAIPKPGKKSAKRKEFERQHWFRRLKRWRSGEEGTISLLKRKYGLERCLLRGDDGTGIWVGLSVFAHNLDKLARMAG